MIEPLGRAAIHRIVNRYIGVVGGYLGDFSYRTHEEFYIEYCNLEINPYDYQGTTRERFIAILSGARPQDQAKIIRGVLTRFPVDQANSPDSRTEALRDELRTLADELEGFGIIDLGVPTYTVEVVGRAIRDAELLMKVNGATSAVDRVHTALHGYLLKICREARLLHPAEPTLPVLLKVLRDQHPAFQVMEPRARDITHILRAAGSILDVMNPLRNNASMAHPTDHLLASEEAMLVVNVAKSILHYLDSKLPDYEARRMPPSAPMPM
jgi:hypothetical protein